MVDLWEAWGFWDLGGQRGLMEEREAGPAEDFGELGGAENLKFPGGQ